MNAGVAGSLLGSLDWVSRDLRPILVRALDGHEVSVEDGIALARAEGRDLHALTLVADELRQRQAGEVVTYVVNRNVNFTNVCIKHCTFCAFSRDHREEEGYFLPVDEVVRRAREASELGATEVCIQAGLPPKLDGRYYIDLTRAITTALPALHIHAFSPEEVLYGSIRSGLPIREYLAEPLRGADVGEGARPRRPAGRHRARGREDARAGAPDARSDLPEHPGLLGQGGAEAGAAAPVGGRQRPGRHADQRVDLHVGRRTVRPARRAGRAAPPHPRRRPGARSARHALRPPSHL